MEDFQQVAPRAVVQAGQDVAAGDQVQVREGRVVQRVVAGEQDAVAQQPAHLDLVAILDEKAGQASWPHVDGDGGGIAPGARGRYRVLIGVGGEDLHRRRTGVAAGALGQQHAE